MKNSTTLSNCKDNSQMLKLQSSIVLAFERTGLTANEPQAQLILNDLKTEFKDVDIEIVVEALRKGGLGYFGKTFKFSSQDACIWVREQLKVVQEQKKSIYKGIALDPRWNDDLLPHSNGNLLDYNNYKNPSRLFVAALSSRLHEEGRYPK